MTSSLYYAALSYAGIFALVAVATYYYNPPLFSQLFARLFPEKRRVSVPYVEQKPIKKAKVKAISTIKQSASTDQAKTGASETNQTKTTGVVGIQANGHVTARTGDGRKVSIPRDEDGNMSNRAFAVELKRAQSGAKLESSPGPSNKPGKRKRESRETPAVASAVAGAALESPSLSTDTSSMTGRDADDDLSSTSSARSQPVSTAATSRVGDVSDMLEPPAPKPMTLSIVGVERKQQRAKPQLTKFEVVETKKQRQRRLKREQEKEAVVQSNAAHELKKQQQMRVARMAEGSSAQTRTNAFQAPKENVWNKVAQMPPNTVQKDSARLLDTFDPSDETTNATNGAVSTASMSDITNQRNPPTTVNKAKSEFGKEKVNAAAASVREMPLERTSSTMSWADDVTEEEMRRLGIPTGPEPKDVWQSVVNKKNKQRG